MPHHRLSTIPAVQQAHCILVHAGMLGMATFLADKVSCWVA
jgi:hypothetical protein